MAVFLPTDTHRELFRAGQKVQVREKLRNRFEDLYVYGTGFSGYTVVKAENEPSACTCPAKSLGVPHYSYCAYLRRVKNRHPQLLFVRPRQAPGFPISGEYFTAEDSLVRKPGDRVRVKGSDRIEIIQLANEKEVAFRSDPLTRIPIGDVTPVEA